MKFHTKISALAISMVTGVSCFMVPVTVKADGLRTDVTPMYRLYNPNSGEHFYTASTEEEAHLAWLGWRYEGVGWYAPKDGNPVYRLYNANGGEHHYTLNEKEKNALVNAGWKDEGIGWYSDPNQGQILYREYNPNAFACNHNYTTSQNEHSHLTGIGWRDEGTAWYGVSTESVDVNAVTPSNSKGWGGLYLDPASNTWHYYDPLTGNEMPVRQVTAGMRAVQQGDNYARDDRYTYDLNSRFQNDTTMECTEFIIRCWRESGTDINGGSNWLDQNKLSSYGFRTGTDTDFKPGDLLFDGLHPVMIVSRNTMPGSNEARYIDCSRWTDWDGNRLYADDIGVHTINGLSDYLQRHEGKYFRYTRG